MQKKQHLKTTPQKTNKTKYKKTHKICNTQKKIFNKTAEVSKQITKEMKGIPQ